MKKLILFLVVVAILLSCKQSSSPKEAAQQFLKAVYASDLPTASSLATTETKDKVANLSPENKHAISPEESFQFSSFTEATSDNSAEVKNDIINLTLAKEGGDWKVKADDKLLSSIKNRENLLAVVQTKWEALLKEYEGRLQAIREYINYKKNIGPLSPKAQALSDMANSFPAYKDWTKEKLLSYVQKQQQLSVAIEDALEPSMAANTDLSVTYFLQISNSTDRIKAAQNAYEQFAQQAHSPVYVTLKVNQ